MARSRAHQQPPPPQPRFVFGQSFLWCSSTGACGQPHVGYALTPAMAPGDDRAEISCYRWDISESMGGMDCPCLGDLVLPSSCCAAAAAVAAALGVGSVGGALAVVVVVAAAALGARRRWRRRRRCWCWGRRRARCGLWWCSSEFLVERNQQQESNESDLVCAPAK
jgi:hypothetical protein